MIWHLSLCSIWIISGISCSIMNIWLWSIKYLLYHLKTFIKRWHLLISSMNSLGADITHVKDWAITTSADKGGTSVYDQGLNFGQAYETFRCWCSSYSYSLSAWYNADISPDSSIWWWKNESKGGHSLFIYNLNPILNFVLLLNRPYIVGI